MTSLRSLPEALAELSRNTVKRKEIVDTCKHDEGVILHRGEEVCARCWICPILARPKGETW